MRLGQLARKYDIRVQDLISYLESEAKEEIHSNTKLSDEQEADVLDFFGIEAIEEPTVQEIPKEPEAVAKAPDAPPEEEDVAEKPKAAKPKAKTTTKKKKKDVSDEEIEWDAEDSSFAPAPKAPALPETPLDDIASVEGEILEPLERPPVEQPAEESVEEVKATEVKAEVPEAPKEDEIIQTDKLLELLESEDPPADLDKIKLIKAPKKELSGLKVVGKVDLPEPPKKKEKPEKEEEVSEIVTEKDLREYRYPKKKKRAPLTPGEKEKRRLRAKQKQEEYEARQEKRKQEQEARKLKELRAKHYQQKLEQQAKAKKVKQKAKQQAEAAEQASKETKPEPKTLLGKFWRWMNT